MYPIVYLGILLINMTKAKLDIVIIQVFNPSTWKLKAGNYIAGSRPAWATRGSVTKMK